VNAELLVIGLITVGLAGLALTQVEEGKGKKGNGEHIFSIIFTTAISLGILLAILSIFVKS
jgi:hypothetical protein